MAGLFVALIVLAAFGAAFWMLESEDWTRMRQGHLPRPSMGAVGPWMRDVLHWRGEEAGQPSEQDRLSPTQASGPDALRQPKVSSPPATPAHPQVAPAPPKSRERSVEDSVYDRLYGGPRSVRKEERDD
jgi:hypothetical protein